MPHPSHRPRLPPPTPTAPTACPARRKLEDALDQKTAELIALRRAAMEHNSKAAVRDAALDRAAEGLLRAGGGSGGGDDWQIAAGGAAPPAGPQPVPVQADSEFGGSETGSPLARSLYAGSGSEFGGGQAAAVAAVDGLQLQLEELRLQHGRELAEREGRWRAHAESLQSRLEAAQAVEQQQQQQQQHGQRGSAAAPGGAAYAAQCDALTKERDALHTILDTKVRRRGKGALVGGGRGQAGPGYGSTSAEQATCRRALAAPPLPYHNCSLYCPLSPSIPAGARAGGRHPAQHGRAAGRGEQHLGWGWKHGVLQRQSAG